MKRTESKTLTRPLTRAPTSTYFYSYNQGKRPSMEDKEIFHKCSTTSWQLFAVCDGHSGKTIVHLLSKLLKPYILGPIRKYYDVNDKLKDVDHHWIPDSTFSKIVQSSILQLDRRLNTIISRGRGRSTGCTLALALYNGQTKQLLLAHVGDSRIVYHPNNGKVRDIYETKDHKPNTTAEWQRIKDSGCEKDWDEKRNRIFGLAMSRAMGDFKLKVNPTKKLNYDPINGAVIAVPDIKIIRVPASGALLLIGCDGIFDVMSSKEAIQFLRKEQKKHQDDIANSRIAHSLILHAYNKGSTDNMTALVIFLLST